MFGYNPSPKPSHSKIDKPKKINHKRNKPTRSQCSNLTPKEDKRLKVRSNGVCERCDRQRATERAHIERRWKSEDRPVAEDFAHLCQSCHRWCDQTKEGREWLKQFGERLRKLKEGA